MEVHGQGQILQSSYKSSQGGVRGLKLDKISNKKILNFECVFTPHAVHTQILRVALITRTGLYPNSQPLSLCCDM